MYPETRLNLMKEQVHSDARNRKTELGDGGKNYTSHPFNSVLQEFASKCCC